MRRAGARTAPRPSAGDLVLLPDPGFVGEPDLYVVGINAFALRDFVQPLSEAFLK